MHRWPTGRADQREFDLLALLVTQPRPGIQPRLSGRAHVERRVRGLRPGGRQPHPPPAQKAGQRGQADRHRSGASVIASRSDAYIPSPHYMIAKTRLRDNPDSLLERILHPDVIGMGWRTTVHSLRRPFRCRIRADAQQRGRDGSVHVRQSRSVAEQRSATCFDPQAATPCAGEGDRLRTCGRPRPWLARRRPSAGRDSSSSTSPTTAYAQVIAHGVVDLSDGQVN